MLLTTLMLTIARGWARGARAIVDWTGRNPARIWGCLAVGMALLALGQHRHAATITAQLHQTKAAWDADRARAQADQIAAQNRYRSLAHDADQAHDAALADGDARLAAYLADHRMPSHPAPHAAGAGQGEPAAVSASAPAGPVLAPIAVGEADLRACDADYAYARAAYDWAQGLNP